MNIITMGRRGPGETGSRHPGHGGTIAGAGVTNTTTVGYTSAVTAVDKLIANLTRTADVDEIQRLFWTY